MSATCSMDGGTYLPANYCNFPTITPPGLHAIYSACRRLYPNQPNPLQVTALLKYWLGGPDPLDYISMYSHPGVPEEDIPAHWHYVSFGLSDLHGDGRVHERGGTSSGFGFELTLRLRQEDNETAPPTWPAALMQALARYVFQSENNLCVGDHIPWHSALDNGESRIQHMLMTDDIQLTPVNSPFGTVRFVQIVGVCSEEIKAAQHWNGAGVLDLLTSVPSAGGKWLITDLRRGESIFEICPQLQERVDRGIEEEGSNLSGVTSRCSWNEIPEDEENSDDIGCSRCRHRPQLSSFESEQIKATLCRGLSNAHTSLRAEPANYRETEPGGSYKSWSSVSSGPPTELLRTRTMDSDPPTELLRTRTLDSVHLQLNLESAALLPLALRGRLRHGRHFTFKSVVSETAFTLLASSVLGSITDEAHPYAAHGQWLQVLLIDDFIDELLHDLSELNDPDTIDVPKHYSWSNKKLAITILPDET